MTGGLARDRRNRSARSARARGDLAARARRRRPRFRADRAGAPAAACRALRVSARADPARDDQQRPRDARLVRHRRLRLRAPKTTRGSARARPRSRGSSTARSSAASRPSGSCSRDSRRAARSRCTLALREPRRLAGVLALSTYLPLAATLAREKSAANAALPIFMAHGEYDPRDPARARRGIAPGPRARGLRRRLARLSDAARGLRARDRRDRGVARRARPLSGSRAARARTRSRTSFVSRALASNERSANVKCPSRPIAMTVEERVP